MNNVVKRAGFAGFILVGMLQASGAQANTVLPGDAYMDQIATPEAVSRMWLADASSLNSGAGTLSNLVTDIDNRAVQFASKASGTENGVQQVGQVSRQVHVAQLSTSATLQMAQVGPDASEASIMLASADSGAFIEERTDRGNYRAVYGAGGDNLVMQQQEGAQLTSLIFQSGERNTATTLQAGLMNYAAVVQRGSDNLAGISQSRSHSLAFISQAGLGNIATIRQ